MKYDLHVYPSIKRGSSFNSTVDVKDEAEAKELLEKLLEQAKNTAYEIEFSTRLFFSGANYVYNEGGFYLVRFSKMLHPAKCIESRLKYGYGRIKNKYSHTFKFLDNGKVVTLIGKRPHTRVVKEFCADGNIGKPDCDSCQLRIMCYTSREKV